MWNIGRASLCFYLNVWLINPESAQHDQLILTCLHNNIGLYYLKKNFLILYFSDYFIWGYLKSKVYSPKPKTLDELEERIRYEIEDLPRETILNAVYSLKNRALKYILNGGGHFEIK